MRQLGSVRKLTFVTPGLDPRAIAYDTTFRFVIPAERRQAREPGSKNPCLALISECRDTWVPDRLASLAVRDDKPKGCKKVICDCPAFRGREERAARTKRGPRG